MEIYLAKVSNRIGRPSAVVEKIRPGREYSKDLHLKRNDVGEARIRIYHEMQQGEL